MKKALEISLNVLVAIAASVMIYQFVNTRVHRVHNAAVGDRLPAIHGIDWAAHESTLVLALRRGCHFCEDSMPFYRQLMTLSQQNELGAFVVAVFPDEDDEVHQVLQTAQLSVPSVSNVNLSKLSVYGTPTLLLVDQRGNIRKVWGGALSGSKEASVVAALKRPGSYPNI